MPQMIAFATAAESFQDAQSIRKASHETSIDVISGLEQGDPGIIHGAKSFLRSHRGDWFVSYLATEHSQHVPDAFPLQNELTRMDIGSAEPALITFLRLLDQSAFPTRDAFFLSATEWNDSDEVLLLEGTVTELVSYLSVVRTTGLWLWSPLTKSAQESDRYPLAFRVITRTALA